MKKAVFLDRDGTLNPLVYNAEFGIVDSPANPDEFSLIPGVAGAVKLINSLGLLAIVISNQPGIAKGKFSINLLEKMTGKMQDELYKKGACLDAVYYCYHHPQGRVAEYSMVCDCRKPKPGLLIQAASEFDVDLSRSYFIGDGITDIQAGQSAGTTNFLIYPSSNCFICEELSRNHTQPDYMVKNLMNAVQIVEQIENCL